MSDRAADWLACVPAALREPIRRAAEGGPSNVALMQLLMQCVEPAEAEDALHGAVARLRTDGDTLAARRLEAVLALSAAHPDAFGVVRSTIDGLDHEPRPGDEQLTYWANAFDRAVGTNPTASVALYALGNPQLLQAATDEIVARLDDWGLLSPATECLDLGCGIGRFELALASRLGRIVGVDIAPAMIEKARHAGAGLPNVEFRRISGRDLAGFPDGSFDLVLAVDSFPYLVQSGTDLMAAMVGEAARVLRRGGQLVALNFSYRGDLARDRSDVAALAARSGFDVVRNGTSEFRLWDGTSFVLRKD